MNWEPISLFLKNEPPEDSPWYEPSLETHRMLRVMESVRTRNGNEGVFRAYRESAARLHNDGSPELDPADVLTAVGLDSAHGAAADDVAWDREIRRRMDEGLALVGQDVGTPIIAVGDGGGSRVGIFGPVITRRPDPEDSLPLWDATVTLASNPLFWELKRTRTENPEFGDRP